ncbi:serine/threonine protein kinase [Scytonema sp. PRP1]|uniref:serine/threonine protein kinase n=1 Tax=Scytonema sp. PRP1 TaxID=3120513 RepID=UPI002FD39B8E
MLAEINPGTLINNRYQVQRLLGQGGFGKTYLASDMQRFGDLCVLKEFVPVNTSEHLLAKSRELFEREAKVLYQINHPHIPKFLAWLTEKQRLFIVQEYIEGKTYSQLLRDRLSRERKPFSQAEVSAWLLDLLLILDYLHQRNIIHRDISLDNVMLSHKLSKPVLIDFGVVKQKVTQILAGDSSDSPNAWHSVAGSMVGKMGYSPPEQIRMGRCYPSSDLYALGVSAVVLLTGKTPRSLLDASFKWQWRSIVNVSEPLGEILEKMLAEKPADRYQSAKEIYNLLQSAILPGSISVSVSHQKIQIYPDVNELELPETIQAEKIKHSNQHSQQPKQKTEAATSFQAEKPSNINPEFLEYCQRELTTSVGPFASVLIKKTLEQTPQMTPSELVEKLAAAIPDPQRAQEFKTNIRIPSQPQSKTKTLPETTPSEQSINSYPVANNPEFLQHCRQELATFVGPFASFVLEDTLAQNPQITPEELVEALAAKIPHQQRAQDFRKRIHIPRH